MATKIETSIIMTHYAEDKVREIFARRAIQSVQPHRNKQTEFIIVFNGIYPYRDQLIKYCDQWNERPADSSPGKSINIATKMAKGNIFFFMDNDVVLKNNAVAECVKLIKKYPQYVISPEYPPAHRVKLNYQLEDEHIGNDRPGDICLCMTRKQVEDIGPRDEIDPRTDGINYTNRRIAKGYKTMITKEELVCNMAPGKHCYMQQMSKMGYGKYKRERAILDKEVLKKLAYGNNRRS